MNEEQVREAVRSALQKIGNSQVSEGQEDQGEVKDPDKEKSSELHAGIQEGDESDEEAVEEGGPVPGSKYGKRKDKYEENFTPREKEHLQENKKRLNDELMQRWGFKKKKEKLNG